MSEDDLESCYDDDSLDDYEPKPVSDDDWLYESQRLNKNLHDLRHEIMQHAEVIAGVRNQLADVNACLCELTNIVASIRDAMVKGTVAT